MITVECFEMFFTIAIKLHVININCYRPNVCTEKEEIVETPDVGTNTKEAATDDFGAIMSSFASTINFSSCSQKPTKYECVTK